MSDIHYPHVDIEFIKECVSGSGKLATDGIVKIGSTITFVLPGNKPIYKRTTSARELEDGQICLEQAISLALKFGFMGQLLSWLETKKNWKDGAYVDPPQRGSVDSVTVN